MKKYIKKGLVLAHIMFVQSLLKEFGKSYTPTFSHKKEVSLVLGLPH